MIERRVIEPGAIVGFAADWSTLAARCARSPFEHPAWLLPWRDHYGAGSESWLLGWWQDGSLVGVAPLLLRDRRGPGRPLRELAFWGRTGTPLGGWVDLVVEDSARAAVIADLRAWLRDGGPAWDLFDFLRLPPDSPALEALAGVRGSHRVDLTRVVHSQEYVLAIPADEPAWPGPLGAKARHEIGRQGRLFERRLAGRLETVTEPAESAALVAAIARHTRTHWGGGEAYFSRDPEFRDFLGAAVASVMRAGVGRALVARDGQGIVGCLLMMESASTSVAVMIGVDPGEAYRPYSLGKWLFSQAIHEAVTRGARTFSFLQEGGYKESFWHAEGRPMESGFVARGARGLAVAAAVTVRRIWPVRLRALVGRAPDEGRYRA